jgi:hypothetical protein
MTGRVDRPTVWPMALIFGMLIVVAAVIAYGQWRDHVMRQTARTARENFEAEWRRRFEQESRSI